MSSPQDVPGTTEKCPGYEASMSGMDGTSKSQLDHSRKKVRLIKMLDRPNPENSIRFKKLGHKEHCECEVVTTRVRKKKAMVF